MVGEEGLELPRLPSEEEKEALSERVEGSGVAEGPGLQGSLGAVDGLARRDADRLPDQDSARLGDSCFRGSLSPRHHASRRGGRIAPGENDASSGEIGR